jgi:hypothetical protein
MPTCAEPIVRFHQLYGGTRAPERADRSACGTLPIRAVRYCESVTTATAFGWWLYPPIDFELLWDGVEIFWRCDQAPDWAPLLHTARLPNYAAVFNTFAPEAVRGFSPPFLTALPEPGSVQLWTGLIAQSLPDWHLLVRAPANLPQTGGIALYEGIVETDRWFGPLFVNMRLTRTHLPIRLRAEYPFALAQPLHRQGYSDDTLDRMDVTPDPSLLTASHWDAYYDTIVEPNRKADRPFGNYARTARKKRHLSARSAQTSPSCPYAIDGERSKRTGHPEELVADHDAQISVKT